MRAAMQNALEGKQIGIDQTEDHHWPNCFDYLRKVTLFPFLFSLSPFSNGPLDTSLLCGWYYWVPRCEWWGWAIASYQWLPDFTTMSISNHGFGGKVEEISSANASRGHYVWPLAQTFSPGAVLRFTQWAKAARGWVLIRKANPTVIGNPIWSVWGPRKE